MKLLVASLLAAGGLFGDSFEGSSPAPDPRPDPLPQLVCYYQSGWPGQAISDAPGNCVDIFAPTLAQMSNAVTAASRRGLYILLDARTEHWKAVVDNPAVVAVSAMDEPDEKGRWPAFLARLRDIKAHTDKPVFCNFGAYATASLTVDRSTGNQTVRHMPHHASKMTINPQPDRKIPTECDWVGYTPSYGTNAIGPIDELFELNRKVLFVLDAYNGWDNTGWFSQCGSPVNCQGWRHGKIRRTMDILAKRPGVVGVHVFLKGRPRGDTGCGTDCQEWLRERLIEDGLY